MSVRYCATASFARRLERSQRLLVTYSMPETFQRESKTGKPSLSVTMKSPEFRGR